VSAIDDTINVNIDAFRKLYPKASREMIENFLRTFDLTTEEIEEYLQNWDMDIKLDEWDYFLENVLNGREMEHSKENLADLQNSFSKLNN
jgi:hypothetical protein